MQRKTHKKNLAHEAKLVAAFPTLRPSGRLKVREIEPEAPFDEQNEATEGPSETPIVE